MLWCRNNSWCISNDVYSIDSANPSKTTINYFMSNNATDTSEAYVIPRLRYCTLGQQIVKLYQLVLLQQDWADGTANKKVPPRDVSYATFAMPSMIVSGPTGIDHRQVVNLSCDWATEDDWQVQKLCCYKTSRNITSQFVIGHLRTNRRNDPCQVVKLSSNQVTIATSMS